MEFPSISRKNSVEVEVCSWAVTTWGWLRFLAMSRVTSSEWRSIPNYLAAFTRYTLSTFSIAGFPFLPEACDPCRKTRGTVQVHGTRGFRGGVPFCLYNRCNGYMGSAKRKSTTSWDPSVQKIIIIQVTWDNHDQPLWKQAQCCFCSQAFYKDIQFRLTSYFKGIGYSTRRWCDNHIYSITIRPSWPGRLMRFEVIGGF